MSAPLSDAVRLPAGDHAVDRLFATLGGRHLRVPTAPTARFEATVGARLARWLCQRHGGTSIVVASRAKPVDRTNAGHVMGMSASERHTGEIADELAIRETIIQRLRNRAAKIDRRACLARSISLLLR